jgi:hypothetical protein
MTIKLAKFFKTVSFFIAVVILLILFTLFGLTSSEKFRNFSLRNFPIPIALVNNQPIYSSELFSRLSLLPSKSQTPDIKNQVLKQLIFEAKQTIVLKNYKAKLGNYNDFLDNSTASEIGIIKSASLAKAKADTYKFWFNSQEHLNSNAYNQAKQILLDFKNQGDFNTLVKQYSQDNSSKEIYGDLGYLQIKDLLFELQNPLSNAEINQVLILPSRKGIHVFNIQNKKISEKGENMLYLKQIFIQPNNYSDWINQQSKTIKTIYFFNSL